LVLVERFVTYGAKAILQTGAQRGGDFLNNQLRGQWAERVVLSMPVEGLRILPFGPSGAAMPGEADHRQVVMTFRQIHLLEGKRPDLVAFDDATWTRLPADARGRAVSWPDRPLDAEDERLVRLARCGVEVKSSTWHYQTRRAAGGGPLSITVKDEELEAIEAWSAEFGVPVVFVQVLFDELYCMSFRRMQEAIRRGYLYALGDYEEDRQTGAGGKVFHRFHLDGDVHLCGGVVFPAESRGVVRVLADGNVVPYIVYEPARAIDAVSAVVRREIDYGAPPAAGAAPR
jgi:hypothetical protein